MGSGAWPFLVGEVICLVYSDNERDLNLLNSGAECLPGEVGTDCWLASGPDPWILDTSAAHFLEGQPTVSGWKFEAITGL